MESEIWFLYRDRRGAVVRDGLSSSVLSELYAFLGIYFQ